MCRFIGENIIDTTVGINVVEIPPTQRIAVERDDVFGIAWQTGTIKYRLVSPCNGRAGYTQGSPHTVLLQEYTFEVVPECRAYFVQAEIIRVATLRLTSMEEIYLLF